ncbi:hypothetical protein BJ138DRAFT_749993 [Hygrophoropsis aurantiaca]|uniref:Uncharacterized protein n=1 Tax=Hygrophoropsis aurantiaca TaxID=72124 RepID=A0ACB8AH68_9AGAM|nr:hypothetical protein BJ138DRAFT_749993 [Hygrophoropsis aurantiaca]
MTYQSKPTSDGTYRIKVLDQDLFIESVPGNDSSLKLAPISQSNSRQKWKLARVPGQTDAWTIASVEDNSGVRYHKTPDTYWGYGYPLPLTGPSERWIIQERTASGKTFSKIKLNGSSNPFDSCSPGSDAVNFYYDNVSITKAPKQCYVFELLPDEPSQASAMDVIFIQDITGSQQPYIDNARATIGSIYSELNLNFVPGNFRVGLITFRDHPPQDLSMVTKVYPLTPDLGVIETRLGDLVATGGGDGPEAQSDALADALTANWNDDAVKVVILITDSPPHGTRISPSDYIDSFPEGCPQQNNPLNIAKRMKSLGITLHVIACQPTLDREFKGARAFYEGLTRKTGGRVFPIVNPDTLASYIVGSLTETADRENLVRSFESEIRKQAKINGTSNVSDISTQVYSDFKSKGIQLKTFVIEDTEEQNDQAGQNAQIWYEAKQLADAKTKLQAVGVSSAVPKYREGVQQKTELKVQPISLFQVEGVVQRCLSKPL